MVCDAVPWAIVILGVTVAAAGHLASTAIGATVADVLPEAVVLGIVGVSFFAFALWGLKGDSLEESERRQAQTPLGALFVVTTAFFLSELGDKTQLATVSIASERDGFVGVWLGSTAGMVAADALAIVVGVVMGKRLPGAVAISAAVLFAVFGTMRSCGRFLRGDCQPHPHLSSTGEELSRKAVRRLVVR